MKNIASNNPYYPLRNRDAILKEAKAIEAKKEAAKATTTKKATIYRKVIHISFTVACLTDIVAMIILPIYCITKNPLFTPIAPIIVGITSIIMIVSFLTSIVASIAKKIWECKLLKLGLLPPN